MFFAIYPDIYLIIFFELNVLKEEIKEEKNVFILEQLHVPICFCLSLFGRLKSGGLLGRREAYIQFLKEMKKC